MCHRMAAPGRCFNCSPQLPADQEPQPSDIGFAVGGKVRSAHDASVGEVVAAGAIAHLERAAAAGRCLREEIVAGQQGMAVRPRAGHSDRRTPRAHQAASCRAPARVGGSSSHRWPSATSIVSWQLPRSGGTRARCIDEGEPTALTSALSPPLGPLAPRQSGQWQPRAGLLARQPDLTTSTVYSLPVSRRTAPVTADGANRRRTMAFMPGLGRRTARSGVSCVSSPFEASLAMRI